jgi:putative ABC transport system permease protein
MLGVALGVAAVVTTASLSSTAARQIDSRFDQVSGTLISVNVPGRLARLGDEQVQKRVSALSGVVEAGMFTALPDSMMKNLPIGALHGGTARDEASLVIATPEGLLARQPTLIAGRLPNATEMKRTPRLAVVGEGLAGSLGLSVVPGRNAFRVNDQTFYLAAIVRDSGSSADLTLSVVLGAHALRSLDVAMPSRQLLVRTVLHATGRIAGEIPLALLPEDPGSVAVTAPADPTQLRSDIGADAAGLTVALAGVALVIGGMGIANAMLVAVMERRSEIGIRRALGASRKSIVLLFVAESATVGALGGLIGACFGYAAAIAVAAQKSWLPNVPAVVLATPVVGLVVGILAGVYPARRAAAVEPVEALRS